jgi:sporulation protein YlmC with PRC-barrel domain
LRLVASILLRLGIIIASKKLIFKLEDNMGAKITLDVEGQFRGIPVISSEGGDKLGEVLDVIVHPADGAVLGLIVRNPEGGNRVLSTTDFFIGTDAVMVTRGAQFSGEDIVKTMSEGLYALRDIVGTNVISENGKLLGRVSEVHLLVTAPMVIYRIAGSRMQRLFGKGFFIPGDLPLSFSHDRTRMVVPASTEDRFADLSLIQVLERMGHLPRAHRKSASG